MDFDDLCHMHESVQAEGLLLFGQQALKLKWRSGRLYDATLPGIYIIWAWVGVWLRWAGQFSRDRWKTSTMRGFRRVCCKYPITVIMIVFMGLLIVVLIAKCYHSGDGFLLRQGLDPYLVDKIIDDKLHVAGMPLKYEGPRANYYPHVSEKKLLADVQTLTRKMDKCFRDTNLSLFDDMSLEIARGSAASYVREFRKVIPLDFKQSSAHPVQHCWKTTYEVHTKNRHIWGHIENVNFDQMVPDDYRSSLLRDVQNDFHNHFSSQTVCLPNLFLLGFPKCGSTFLWCLIERIVNTTIGVRPAAFKEPGWWSERQDGLSKLDASEFGRYIANFVTPIRAMDTSSQENVIIAEGTPGVAYASPRFNPNDHHRINYCLLPAAIPHFLPYAKFIMIMREPADALYSLFWWACKGRLTEKTQKGIPNAFHKGVVIMIDIFNKCMRDETFPDIHQPCSLSSSDYSSCISHPKRLALLDKCVDRMSAYDVSTKRTGMPRCAKIGFNMYMYFIHVRRWLSATEQPERFYFLTLNDTSDSITVARRVFQLMDISLPINFNEVVRQAYTECQRRKNTQKISYSSDPALQMRQDTRMILKSFFAPFNQMLSQSLGDTKFLFM